jgi:hypothetical protein
MSQLRVACLGLVGLALAAVSPAADNLVINGDFATSGSSLFWSASPLGTPNNTITWRGDKNSSGTGTGALEVTVTSGTVDNSSVASAIDGAVQFNYINFSSTTVGGETLIMSAYVLIESPLTQVAGISSGQGGAAVAPIDGLVDFTGAITADANRLLGVTAGWQKIEADPLVVPATGHGYNLYLMVRNATGTAFFDEVAVAPAPARVADYDLYN